MWSPTHIQVTVHRARNLLTKGKNGRNNCYVTICVGKDKYMTTQQKDAGPNLEWHEQCELPIPEKGNRSELVLTCLHQNNFGLDDFLGQIALPLNEMDVYEQPRPRWYKLQSKPGKEKQKERGELEVRIGFTVKSGSLTDLSKGKEKHKSSMGQLASNNVGGSLLSINTLEKRKSLKKFAKSLGSKMHITGKKEKKEKHRGDDDSLAGSTSNVWPTPDMGQRRRQLGGAAAGGQKVGESDPGVISEDDDEFAFEHLSHKSSGSSLNVRGGGGGGGAYQTHTGRSPAVSVHSVNSSAADVTAPVVPTAAGGMEDRDEFKNRSMTLPPPAKPQRNVDVAAAPAKDEWAEKLYGSSDSLKRRSWEPAAARVPLEGSSSRDSVVQQVASTTAPSSPAVSARIPAAGVRSSLPGTAATGAVRGSPMVPQPLPRSNTLESVAEKTTTGEKQKKGDQKENKFTKKLKYLREFGRGDAASPSGSDGSERRIKPTLSGQFYNNQSERIIIGHENDLKMSNGELPKEVVQRYEGKTREEIMVTAYQMENEVKYQKQRVKELEDYLDNLLLRVMETHPKILQNPYSKLNSTKSG